MAGKIVDASDNSFDQEVLKSDLPVLVDFWAPWCGPCRTIAPVLEELAREYDGKLKVVKVNVDNNKQAAAQFHVRSIPHMILFKDGESKDQIVGVVAKQELIDAIKKTI